MLKNVQDYYYPGSLAEASELHDRESRSFFIAGGTALALSESSRPVELIDLGELGLDDLEVDEDRNQIEIGSTTKIQRIVNDNEIRSVLGGYLAESLEKIGSYPVRNAGTLGGSMVRPFPWSDVIPILSVLDTTVSYYHRDGEGRRDLASLYNSDFRSTLNRSIIKDISISLPESGETAAKFIKFSRSEFDVSALNLACRLTVERGTITEARLSIGARPMTGERVTNLEENLVGEKLTEDLAEAAGVSAADLAELGGDDRLSEDYRKELVKKMTTEALMDIKKEVANES